MDEFLQESYEQSFYFHSQTLYFGFEIRPEVSILISFVNDCCAGFQLICIYENAKGIYGFQDD